jgi:hypothetical protein
MFPPQRARTLTAFMLRALVPRLALFAAAAAVVVAGQWMSPRPSVDTSAIGTDRTLPLPAWSAVDRAAHPDCIPAAEWVPGRLARGVVVQTVRDSEHRKISFDRAWRRNHNGTDVDDVWVLGLCP